MDQAENQKMWDRRAHSIASDDAVTHHDSHKKGLQLDLLSRHLGPHMRVLEAGCGSGFDTEFLSRRVCVVDAFDQSKGMIRRARRRLEGAGNVNLYVDALPSPRRPELQADYDLVVSARVVCNLLDRDSQSRALSWLAGRVKPGGKLVLFETMSEAFVRLGALCQETGLEPVTAPGFNLALSRSFIGNALPRAFELVADGGMGAYDVATRVLREFVDDREQTNTRFHEGAARLTRALGDNVLREFSTICYLVFENRSSQDPSASGPSSSRAAQFRAACTKLGINCPQTLDISNTQVLVPSQASIYHFADHLEVQESVLDMGCGIGILSALALTKGAREVTSVDISAAAVRETRKLVPSATVKQSDLFEDVAGSFGSILFNAPWGDGRITTDLDRAKFDSPGLMKRFLDAAPSHLLPGGDVWIQYGDASLKNLARLLLGIAESQFQVADSWTTKVRFRESARPISLHLYRLTRS
ncbi:class I SAM-dependent methyltransferase [Sorangium sp. So ce1128]